MSVVQCRKSLFNAIMRVMLTVAGSEIDEGK